VAHMAPVLVDDLHLARRHLDARDLGQGLEVVELAKEPVRE
jgi:hypothetical protein